VNEANVEIFTVTCGLSIQHRIGKYLNDFTLSNLPATANTYRKQLLFHARQYNLTIKDRRRRLYVTGLESHEINFLHLLSKEGEDGPMTLEYVMNLVGIQIEELNWATDGCIDQHIISKGMTKLEERAMKVAIGKSIESYEVGKNDASTRVKSADSGGVEESDIESVKGGNGVIGGVEVVNMVKDEVASNVGEVAGELAVSTNKLSEDPEDSENIKEPLA